MESILRMVSVSYVERDKYTEYSKNKVVFLM